ncbi:hypothetical protein WJX81_001953 [Elliptochloris bilobata]|uniref:Uncharacterized protein n=1 Tax=Elliptochloris bilobata TaxID=381761 RepID=A0AAW1RIF3_9CHLO
MAQFIRNLYQDLKKQHKLLSAPASSTPEYLVKVPGYGEFDLPPAVLRFSKKTITWEATDLAETGDGRINAGVAHSLTDFWTHVACPFNLTAYVDGQPIPLQI